MGARWLETDSLSNQDISTGLAIGVYTADADRFVAPQLLIDAAAGNGDYVYYMTLRVNGAGSSYVIGPKTTSAAASGETAIGAQGGFVFVRSGDVLTVYVDGLAGDNATPDTIVRWAELEALAPATAGRTLAVSESGEVTVTGTVQAQLVDGVTHGGTAALMTLKKMLWTDSAYGANPFEIAAANGTAIKTAGSISQNNPFLVGLQNDAITDAALSTGGLAALVKRDTGETEAVAGSVAQLAQGGLTAQQTADAVNNLAPASTPAANSIGAHLDTLIASPGGLTAQEVADAGLLAPTPPATAATGSVQKRLADMPATILTTAVAGYAGTIGTVGYLLSLLAGLDFTAVNLVATSNAGEITIRRTLTLAAVVSGLTIPADWTAAYWTVKRSVDDADADALVQILVSNPADAEGDGLLVLAGAAVEDPSAGSLTVNQAGGTVTIALDADSTATLYDAVELVWDVKIHAPDAKTQPGAGTATITTAVTRT